MKWRPGKVPNPVDVTFPSDPSTEEHRVQDFPLSLLFVLFPRVTIPTSEHPFSNLSRQSLSKTLLYKVDSGLIIVPRSVYLWSLLVTLPFCSYFRDSTFFPSHKLFVCFLLCLTGLVSFFTPSTTIYSNLSVHSRYNVFRPIRYHSSCLTKKCIPLYRKIF